jgi:hypothetical protein
VLVLLLLSRQALRRLELELVLVLLRRLQLLLVLLVLLWLLVAQVLLLLVCRVALLWRQLELALDVSGAGRVDKCPSLTARVAVVPQDVVEVRPSEDGWGGCSSHGALVGAMAWKVMEDACSRQRFSHARTAGAFTFLCAVSGVDRGCVNDADRRRVGGVLATARAASSSSTRAGRRRTREGLPPRLVRRSSEVIF